MRVEASANGQPNYFAGKHSPSLAKLGVQGEVDSAGHYCYRSAANSSGGCVAKLPHAEPSLWRWASAGASPPCSLRPVTLSGWCDAMSNLGLSRTMYVGDSLQMDAAMSMDFLLSLPTTSAKRNIGWTYLSKFNCGPSLATQELRIIRNDWLSDPLIGRRCSKCECMTKNWHASTDHCVPFLSEYLAGNRSTLLFVNVGVHAHSVADFRSAVESFVDELALATNGTSVKSDRDLGRDHLVFRTTVPGHAGCGSARAPLEEAPLNISTAYDWNLIPDYNREASIAINDAYARLPLQFHVLDVMPMTLLRPDGHLGPHDKVKEDCLHYQMPGVPDWWNAALLAFLEALHADQLSV